ncbi:aminopeptidase N [Geothermobacter ehrlichii]|uniref:Aminopeptidase N n=1 Tax=Geothermobacter ehrlichii TaxID=213224 RepID=A0A5D3WLL3_9BACT|nr:aminopeptidase N [Geothermobacter ehrlichii]TYO98119.1 aminopeptidase N [Geothermobacter ehrlichii]
MADDTRIFHRGDYRPYPWLVDRVELDFHLDPRATEVTGRLHLRRRPDCPGEPLFLDGKQLELVAIRLDGTKLPAHRFRHDDEGLTIPDLPAQCVLETTVRIDPAANTALEGLYLSNGTFCTQCEAQGFRHITFFPDRPDVLSRFTTRIVADRKQWPVLLANGNPIRREELADGRHGVTWEDPFPKPCYLFALVAGDLAEIGDSFTTASGREVALRFYVEHHHRDKVGHAMQALKKAMRWDEERFGREYDLDIYMVVAVDDFNMGAMENKGLNVFNSKYVLARPDTATDADYQAIEEVIAHEYFHNWTGNRITCRDWFQLSLKEGLTVFRDQEFSADQVHRDVKRIEDVRLLRNSQFPEDAGPMAHPVQPDSYRQINNFYTMTVYHKGAEVISMVQTLLGTDGFRRGMDLYFTRHDGQAVTCDDFLACMAEAGGRDLAQFGRWYSQAGTPRLTANGRYEADSGRFILELRQSCPPTPGQPQKLPFHLPVRLALLDRAGRELPLRLEGDTAAPATERVLELREEKQTFVFINLPERPVLSLLRGFSAPVVLDCPFRDEDLAFLLAHDSDPFCRWDAGQTLATRTLLQLTDRFRSGDDPERVPLPVAALRQALLDERATPALRAQLLTPPGETYLAEQVDEVDPGAIHRARRFYLGRVAGALADDLRRLYRQLADTAPYRYAPEEASRRSLRNLCLTWLLLSGRPECQTLAEEQYHTADNMTDRLAALRALVDSASPAADALLADFHRRYRSEALVVDKWFALQAAAPGEATLERVATLAAHPDFKLKNPNRCRALFGTFAHANQAAFHRPDGAGYRLVAERVTELDRLNPQVAARLVSAFNRWRRMEPMRRELMRQQLEYLRAGCHSSDVLEIVDKALAAETKA